MVGKHSVTRWEGPVSLRGEEHDVEKKGDGYCLAQRVYMYREIAAAERMFVKCSGM